MTERDIVYELREIQRMNTTLHGAQMAARAADEIQRLRAERDEARRELDDARRERHDAQRWEFFKEKP